MGVSEMNKRHLKIGRYQQGAETVEFMITLLIFMFIVIMIIEFAILTYDRGAMGNAARMGTRQATLYWADPALFNPTTPLANRRLKPQMVQSVMDWVENNVLIDTGNSGLTPSLLLDATVVDLTSSVPVVVPTVVDTAVTVNVGYAHQYIALSGFIPAAGPTMNTQSASRVE